MPLTNKHVPVDGRCCFRDVTNIAEIDQNRRFLHWPSICSAKMDLIEPIDEKSLLGRI
jgi:hypothetical protein